MYYPLDERLWRVMVVALLVDPAPGNRLFRSPDCFATAAGRTAHSIMARY